MNKELAKQTDAELSFEEAVAKLEKIVADMESGKVGLEKSMELFEEGSRLSRFCMNKLGETEKRIEILLRQAEGQEPEWRDAAADFATASE